MRNWLYNLAMEMQRPANDVIRELLQDHSVRATAGIIGVSPHTLLNHCKRAGIAYQRHKQAQERKPVKTTAVNTRSRLITANGQTMRLIEWSRLTGIPTETIRSRIDRYGWTTERALSNDPRRI